MTAATQEWLDQARALASDIDPESAETDDGYEALDRAVDMVNRVICQQCYSYFDP